jgi:oxygen-dependent protoporphyrinogen oxidase
MTPRRVVVIGGGITGLSLAHALNEEARAHGIPLDLRLLEAGHPGGHARTIRRDGFLVESGPNGFLNREPETMALVSALGLESQLVEASPHARRRFIVRGGHLRRVPDSPLSLLASDAISARGKLRLLAEPFARKAPDGVEESVYDFARRRIGEEAATMLVDAAVSGISAGDSRVLSVRSQFPMMVDMEREHGSLIRAMIARRKRRQGPARLLSFREGMSTLIETLVGRLGPIVRAGTPVSHIARGETGWRIETASGDAIEADWVVLATSARVAAPLVSGHDRELAGALATIPFAGLSCVALAYRLSDVPRTLDGYGYLTTRPEGLATLGVVWESSLFPGRAPEGHALLRVMIGGSRRPAVATLDEVAVTDLAREELAKVMSITAAPLHRWAFRWPDAIAQYNIGHAERIAAIRARAARHPGLTFCGTSYDGASFNNAVATGRRTARQLVASFGTNPANVAAAAIAPALAS